MASQDSQPKNFDPDWYLKHNPDVAASGMDAYAHYISLGFVEGRQPAPIPILEHVIRRIKVLFHIATIMVRGENNFKDTTQAIQASYAEKGWKGVKSKLVSLYDKDITSNYASWVRRYDTVNKEQRQKIRQRIASMNALPLISVIMPTYNSNLQWLTEAIESVQRQIYPNWELCIADDCSTDPAVRTLLTKFADNDPRIKIMFREQNGHIPAASNSALSLASGDWVALLDHDDVLSEHALFWVVDAINRNPDIRMTYSDEDKIDEQGHRCYPYFKCDWNYDLYLSCMYMSHLSVYSMPLVRKLGGFREHIHGSQDFDLGLRFIEEVEPEQIYHIPRILYHWRLHPESTAHSMCKPYAYEASISAAQDHFKRQNINATVSWDDNGLRIKYTLPEESPMVSLIIPTRNGLTLIRRCITSIQEKTTYQNYEILVVDNGSDDLEVLAYLESLSADPRIRIFQDDRPFNYSQLNNSAVESAKGDVIGFLNNDTEVITPDWIREMVSHVLRPTVGVAGARLWYPNDMLQHGGVVLGMSGTVGHAHKLFPKGHAGYHGRMAVVSEYSAVTGACMFIEKSLFQSVGGFDEQDLGIAGNDIDLCLKVRQAGYKTVWTPHADLYHYESMTRGYDNNLEDQVRSQSEALSLRAKWGDLFKADPAYSPNLTLEYTNFAPAWPPRIDLQI